MLKKEVNMKMFKIISIALALVFVGCAQPGVQEVGAGATNYVLNYETGTIVSIRSVVIKDNGTGTFIGGLIGAVLGSTMGRGRGSALTTLAGGLAGAYAGNQIGKANAQELTVQLDGSEATIVAITKGMKYYTGEHIRIVKRDRKIIRVEAY